MPGICNENEKESADLWKTCNASMRQYVDSAAEGMKAVADSNRISEELLREDKKMIEDFEARDEMNLLSRPRKIGQQCSG